MSKKVERVGLEPTTFGFPCLRSYQLSYRSDNGTEAVKIVYTVHFITVYTGIHTVIELLDYTYLLLDIRPSAALINPGLIGLSYCNS